MNSYTLENLKQDLDHEFAPLTIEVGGDALVLRNLMRVGDGERQSIMEQLQELEVIQSEDRDPTPQETTRLSQIVVSILSTVTADDKGNKLASALSGDLMLAMKIMELWQEATQPGEASNSPA